jgi:hypothetical protein
LGGFRAADPSRSRDVEGKPAVAITFNNEGGDLLATLTRKNVPSESGIA